MSRSRALLVSAGALLLAACASAPSLPAQGAAGNTRAGGLPVGDTLDANWVPTGFGSLRQDDIALRITPANGLQVRAIPLDERFIRLLSPDSYRTLHDLAANRATALNAIRERNRLPAYSLWYVSFFALEQGETRFSPNELIINNTGRDFRPLDLVPLTPGFGEYRLKQREVQSALLVFDGQLDLNQPLTATMEGTSSATDWSGVLQRVERERSLVRSRAQAQRKPPE
ncbi:MAG: hypothetical protein K2R93_13285 [Gemmatimonadaceae bacterium]|nr:hypothetical protein [Gemmatimonadaceae bacterium]